MGEIALNRDGHSALEGQSSGKDNNVSDKNDSTTTTSSTAATTTATGAG